MGKKLVIGIILLFGFFALPNVSVACMMHGDQKASCCHKEATAQTSSSVPAKESAARSAVPHTNCEGQCNQPSCQCGTMNGGVALATFACLENRVEHATKERLLPGDAHTIPGFYSIWLPPKIG